MASTPQTNMDIPLINNDGPPMANGETTRFEPIRWKTPSYCVADFVVVPIRDNPASKSGKSRGLMDRYKAGMTKMVGAQQIGLNSGGLSKESVDLERLLQSSGLRFEMHSAGTSVEGPWDDVMRIIGQAHVMLHDKGIAKIQTDIRVGSRSDQDKVPLSNDEEQSQSSRSSNHKGTRP